jgi:hypothetical protein
MLLDLRNLVIREAKLDVPVESAILQNRQQITLSSISTAQKAHHIKPVTRQRDDQARLMNDSRRVSLLSGDREPLSAVASGLLSSDRGQMKGVLTPFIWLRTGKREKKGNKRDV